MIYPGKKKVRSFAQGGGTASLFDNPGTYLGIQYIPTKQELPDVDGLQYLVQMEQAKIASAAKAKEAAKGKDKNISEIFKGVYDEIGKVDALTGESQSFFNQVESDINSWAEKYNTSDAMNSNEANQDMLRIQNNVTRNVLALKNNKQLWKEKYDAAEPVRSNTYVNQGHIMLQPDDPTKAPEHVRLDEYYAEREGKYKDKAPMTVGQLFDWRRNYSGFALSDPFNVRQYDSETTRKYIDNSFKSFATNSSSIAGGEQLKGMLEQAGLDPNQLDVHQFKLKLKNGELNGATLFNVFAKNLDSQARDSIMASMYENNINPFEVVRTEKDENGEEFNVTAFQEYLYEMYVGEKAKKMNTEEEVIIESPEEIAAKAKANGGADEPTLNRLTFLQTDNYSLEASAKVLNKPIEQVRIFNPELGKTQFLPAIRIHEINNDEVEALTGDKLTYRQITKPITIHTPGGAVEIRAEDFSGSNATGARFYSTPINNGLIVYNVNNNEKDYSDGSKRITALDTYIYVNEAGLRKMNNPLNGDFLRDNNYSKVDGITKMSREEVAKEAITHGQGNSMNGAGAEEGMTFESTWKDWIPFVEDKYLYKVRVTIPVSNIAGTGGVSPSKSQHEILNDIRKQQEALAAQADSLASSMDSTKVKEARDIILNHGK